MKTYDYYCTWQAQNIFCQVKHVSNRDYMDEDALFKEDGLVHAYKEFRKDLYFILDDGWDVPYSYNVKEDYPFASHVIKNDRFKSFKGKPQEKLKQMVDQIMAYGWKGVGIWVCAQGNGKAYKRSINGLKSFFKTRLEWSKYAHVAYWKVDWGTYCNEVAFRKMLTKLAKAIYPELIIENCMCINPVNGFNDYEEEHLKYQYPWYKKQKRYIDKVNQISEVFRSYDVTEELSVTSTLARLAYLLKQNHSIINCEDELYMGAILGCAYGIERNRLCSEVGIAPRMSFHYRSNEVYAAMRYRQISPCFTGGKIKVSKETFLDEYAFGPYWAANVTQQVVKQLCPARVARNTALPKVSKLKEVPYVVCCKDFNHNYAIGTFKRLVEEEDAQYAINASVKLDEMVNNIAIFSNHIQKLTVTFPEMVKVKQFVLVDLIHNVEVDVTHQIQVKEQKIVVQYAKLTKDFTCDDDSTKAYLLKLIY